MAAIITNGCAFVVDCASNASCGTGNDFWFDLAVSIAASVAGATEACSFAVDEQP
jgi:hypothetical protein